MRVRKDVFCGIAYVPGHEQQIHLDKNRHEIFEIFQRTQDRYEVTGELKKRNRSNQAESEVIHHLLRQFFMEDCYTCNKN
ncbi:MAG: hypothetical protein AYK19_10460 [Theionarchaea archaeon DG-70-1]|nr:MAG: hypothetical protein AYK19_10460 [Theionarchaea archaeon DG-70-1]